MTGKLVVTNEKCHSPISYLHREVSSMCNYLNVYIVVALVC